MSMMSMKDVILKYVLMKKGQHFADLLTSFILSQMSCITYPPTYPASYLKA